MDREQLRTIHWEPSAHDTGGVKLPSAVYESSISAFCQPCDCFDSKTNLCNSLTSQLQALRVGFGICDLAIIDGRRGIMLVEGFEPKDKSI